MFSLSFDGLIDLGKYLLVKLSYQLCSRTSIIIRLTSRLEARFVMCEVFVEVVQGVANLFTF